MEIGAISGVILASIGIFTSGTLSTYALERKLMSKIDGQLALFDSTPMAENRSIRVVNICCFWITPFVLIGLSANWIFSVIILLSQFINYKLFFRYQFKSLFNEKSHDPWSKPSPTRKEMLKWLADNPSVAQKLASVSDPLLGKKLQKIFTQKEPIRNNTLKQFTKSLRKRAANPS